MKKRLRAFTLIELIVAMALTGIVITIAGISYIIVTKQLGRFSEQATKEYSLHRAAGLLYMDFQESGIVYSGVGGIRFSKNDGTEVSYQFEKAKVTRLVGATHEDLGIGAENYEVLFAKEHGGRNGIIDEMSIILKHEQEVYQLQLNKQYSAAELLQIETP